MVSDFRIDVKSQVNRLEGGAKGDLQSKYASLLAFDYEAAARLKAWDSLDEIIKVCKPDSYEYSWLKDNLSHPSAGYHAAQASPTSPPSPQLNAHLGIAGLRRFANIWLICRYHAVL